TGQRMSALVIGNYVQVLFAQDERAFRANEDFIKSLFKAVLRNIIEVTARCQKGCLVDQVGNISADHAGGAARDSYEVYIRTQGNIFGIYFENGKTAIPVGTFHRDAPVEATWTQQSFIKSIGSVGSGNDDHRLARIEAVHLDQQLVEGLLAFVVAVDAGAALATHRVDFVDEDDAGRGFLGLIEQVAHATGSHAHQHFHELRPAYREEWHASFPGYRAGQQRLAGSRRAYQQHTAWYLAAKFLEFARRLQKLHHFHEIIFGLVHACHIREGGAGTIFYDYFGFALAKAEDVLLALIGAPEYEEEKANQQYPG